MNRIPELQISEKQLARLRAARALYAQAKTLLAVQIVLSVPFAVLWSVLGIFVPDTKIIASVWGITVVLLDHLFFTPRQKALKTKAATIQETFDCDVLTFEWRSIHVGRHPEPEELMEWSEKYGVGTNDQLMNWYPKAVGVLPLPLARAICQRANCWWDSTLRRRYATWSIGVVTAVFALAFCSGMAGHFSLDQWVLSVMTPLVPVFTLGLRQSSEQKDAADRLDALKRHAESMWADVLAGASDAESAVLSRELQDELFDHRRRNPLIFDWVYQRLRNKQEEQMNRSAGELVQEALDKGF